MHRVASKDIPAPLPLFKFEDQFVTPTPIAYAEPLPSIEHRESQADGGKLYNVIPNIGLARLLSYQTINDYKSEMLAYESTITPDNFQEFNYQQSTHLEFSSKFESGNLWRAYAVEREYAVPAHFSFKKTTDFEYDLMLRPDIHSKGNTQWYYFKISNRGINKYPITVRLNIVNLRKDKSVYSYGCRPAIYSSMAQNWCHQGNDVCYYKNDSSFTLTFTYTFECLDEVYVASCYPYTYSDLQKYLSNLQKDERKSKYIRRKLLCKSLYRNRCEILTISSPSSPLNYEANKSKPVVVVFGRVHPGESNGSYVVEGLIDFLVSDCAEANAVLSLYTFKVVPMLNPDGVINGNYRCSLAGSDLNRRYLDAHRELHPTITAVKQLLNHLHYTRGVSLFLDIHGHSAKKNTFIYGCDVSLEQKRGQKHLIPRHSSEFHTQRVFSRLFPRVLAHISSHFSYRDCDYRVQLSKSGTGRVTSWKSVGIPAAYTIEVSLCGNS